MAASTTNRATVRNGEGLPERIAVGLAASTTVYEGCMVGVNASGYLVNASADPALRIIGTAESKVDNASGSAAAKTATVCCDAQWFGNSASTDAIAISEIGKPCFAVDNQTVAKTNGTGTRPVAGIVVGVDTVHGVCVAFGLATRAVNPILTVTSAFAYNDSDLAVAATSATRNLSGLLPVGAVVLGYDIDTTADWTDGSTGTFALNLGDGTTATLYASDAGNLDGGASRASAAIMKPITTSSRIVATVSSSVNLNTLTGGASTLRIFYVLP